MLIVSILLVINIMILITAIGLLRRNKSIENKLDDIYINMDTLLIRIEQLLSKVKGDNYDE
jgi:hypothetical protein